MNKEIILTKIAALETALAELRREVEGDAPEVDGKYIGFEYPPCDISNAEVGDKLELWSGYIESITKTDDSGLYPIVSEIDGQISSFTTSGIFDRKKTDTPHNVRRLIKKNPTV